MNNNFVYRLRYYSCSCIIRFLYAVRQFMRWHSHQAHAHMCEEYRKLRADGVQYVLTTTYRGVKFYRRIQSTIIVLLVRNRLSVYYGDAPCVKYMFKFSQLKMIGNNVNAQAHDAFAIHNSQANELKNST